MKLRMCRNGTGRPQPAGASRGFGPKGSDGKRPLLAVENRQRREQKACIRWQSQKSRRMAVLKAVFGAGLDEIVAAGIKLGLEPSPMTAWL